MKVLITGGSGFIGASLVHKLLDRGADVGLLLRPHSNLWRLGTREKEVSIVSGDLKDRTKVFSFVKDFKPEIIYHCAAYGTYPSQADPILSTEANVLGTINLVDAAVENSVGTLIHLGSCSEYGRKSTPMREADILEPVYTYGVTKAAATLYCEMMGRKHKARILTLRLFSTYGPFEEPTRLIPSVIAACLKQRPDRPLKLSTGKEARDFIFVDDVTDLAMKAPKLNWECGDIVNVGSGQQDSVRTIVEETLRLTKTDFVPQFGTLPPREFDSSIWQANIEKARRLWNWSPQTSLSEGLKHTIEWQKTNAVVPSVIS